MREDLVDSTSEDLKRVLRRFQMALRRRRRSSRLHPCKEAVTLVALHGLVAAIFHELQGRAAGDDLHELDALPGAEP